MGGISIAIAEIWRHIFKNYPRPDTIQDRTTVLLPFSLYLRTAPRVKSDPQFELRQQALMKR